MRLCNVSISTVVDPCDWVNIFFCRLESTRSFVLLKDQRGGSTENVDVNSTLVQSPDEVDPSGCTVFLDWLRISSNCCAAERLKCNEEGRVTAIVMKNKDLSGRPSCKCCFFKKICQIVGSIAYLSDMSNSRINGSLTESISKLTNLQNLDFTLSAKSFGLDQLVFESQFIRSQFPH